ncbi:leucine-rich repeat domain-containing protein [uncultured Prevotella sp.]|uniref:leucine-rich repeat domain-containing protein n=1 Tax=uncultured Prevotella sp. TaxID=159272 RepID=UPI0027E3505F|nr:leucine-rich repeat domain-containing protein [uncultured Prevotella sp.]
MIINRSFSSSFAKEERFGSLKSLVLLVAFAILATSNTYAQASFETIDGLRYLIDSDAKTAMLTVNNGEKYSGYIVVPEKVKASDGVEYPVTAFAANTFKECKGLKSISIPSSVTSLGNSCFEYCSGLTSITIPSSVISLGNDCFLECSGLTSITIPSSVTSLGESCFTSCI